MSTLLSAMTTSLRSYWLDARPVQRAAYVVGAVLILIGLGHAVAWLIVGGTAEGPLSWRKPTTFGISFGIATITLAWVSRFLSLSGRALGLSVGAMAVADTMEVLWVSVQRARGVPSHYNLTTLLDTTLYFANGAAVAVTIAVIAFFAVRSFTSSTAAPSMTLALRAGLVLLLVSMATGAWMIVNGSVLDSATPAAVPAEGSIKAFHAVGMHGIQVLAVLGWLLSFGALTETARGRVVAVAAAGYALLVATVGGLTIAGVGPLAPEPAGLAGTVVALVLVLGAYAAAGLALLRTAREPVGDGMPEPTMRF